MKFFIMEPEVAGGFGEGTILDSSTHPPAVSKLNYEFYGWMGDPMLEFFAQFIVTENLANKFEMASLSGYLLDTVDTSVSQEFKDLHPGVDLPAFVWLRISGAAGSDDFGMAEDSRLVVSERVLKVLEEFRVENATFESFGAL